MNTRFRYDPAREIKHLQQSTDVGRYILNVPGVGDAPPFMADPHIRLQRWAGNLHSNAVEVEESLRGQPISRATMSGLTKCDGFQATVAPNETYIYGSSNALTTDQPRASDPAWLLREAPLAAPMAVYRMPPTELPFAVIHSRDLEARCPDRPVRF